EAVGRVGLEREVAPPPARASPDETAAAQMIAADPAELLRRVALVRMLAVADEEVLRRFAERVVLALDGIVARVQLAVAAAAVREVPRLHPLGDVVLPV